MPRDAAVSDPAAGGTLSHLPAFFAVTGRRIVVVGGAAVAPAKLALARRAGAAVTWIASSPPDPGSDAVVWIARAPEPRDFTGAALAFVATGDAAADAAAAALARAARVPVNVADRPDLCDFILPAIIDRAPVVVAVSTGGASPTVAKLAKRLIETALPPGFGRLAAFARRMKHKVEAVVPPSGRRGFWDAVLDGAVGRHAVAGREGEAEAALDRALSAGDVAVIPLGTVALVGAGPGAPDLLTLRAVRLLQQADVILHDDLVDPRVLDLARSESRRIAVGKRAGRPSWSQAEVSALMCAEAGAGRRVVRLKGGDPLVFGRAGEELAALAEAGVSAEVVPGVTSALGAAATLQLPLTRRGVSRRITLAAAAGADGALPAGELAELAAAASSGTLALYMSGRGLRRTARLLMAGGLAGDTPAVAVSAASTAREQQVVARLHALAATVEQAAFCGPTLVVIGAAVAATPAWRAAHPDEARASPVAIPAA